MSETIDNLRSLNERIEFREADGVVGLTFRVGGRAVGQFWYDESSHEFQFDGETEVSAKMFAEMCLRELKEQLRGGEH